MHTQQPNSRKVTKSHFLTFEALNENICRLISGLFMNQVLVDLIESDKTSLNLCRFDQVDLLTYRACRRRLGSTGERCGVGRSFSANEMAWRGLPGTRSMVFCNINDVTSHLPHGISWCQCKYKVEVMRRFRRFVWG